MRRVVCVGKGGKRRGRAMAQNSFQQLGFDGSYNHFLSLDATIMV